MRAIILAGLLSLATGLPVLAALPPQYQRQRELLAIINDMEVLDAFGFDGIDAIERVARDLYQVRGGKCVLEVGIEDLPNTHGEGWAGPREFTIVVGEPTCKQ
jgi:hypothetical protein